MEDLVMDEIFDSIYKNKRVFITGHSGFKGSWLAAWLVKLGAQVSGLSLLERTKPSHHDLLRLEIDNYYGDVCDRSFLEKSLLEAKPDIVFHLAAQALVRESYRDPFQTYYTNVIGTLNVLQAVKKLSAPVVVINVTTDKVYKNEEWQWPYREIDRLGGYDLYSSSKACSEILTESFRNSFFNTEDYGKSHQVLVATARAGNVIGGGDWAPDRLIPDIIRSIEKGEMIEIRNPNAIRPWEHVLEPLSGYLLLGQQLINGKKHFSSAWNFGPDSDEATSVAIILSKIKKYWPEISWKSIDATSEKMHEAKTLRIDCSKSFAELSWKSVWGIDRALERTSCWYKDFYEGNKVNTWDDIDDYVRCAREKKINWCCQ